MKPVRDYGRILLGLVVVAFGAVFLLDSLGAADSGQVIGDWWPLVIVAMALFQFAEGTHGVVGPSIFLAVGSLLLLFSTGVLSGNAWDYIWPTAIIVAGVYIISRWRSSGKEKELASDDVIVADGIFGGPTVASGSQSFRAASLTAVFGGVTLDLRAARPVPEGANVKATAAFGGIEILVPHGWRVVVKATPIFGGIDDKTVHDSALPDDAPVLKVDGLALFGGVEIKHEK